MNTENVLHIYITNLKPNHVTYLYHVSKSNTMGFHLVVLDLGVSGQSNDDYRIRKRKTLP